MLAQVTKTVRSVATTPRLQRAHEAERHGPVLPLAEEYEGSNPTSVYYPQDEPPVGDPMCCMNSCVECVLVEKYLFRSNQTKGDPAGANYDALAALEARLVEKHRSNEHAKP